MAAIIAHRLELAAIRTADFKRICEVQASEDALALLNSSSAAASSIGTRSSPIIGTGVTVHSESALRAEKERQKHENKIRRHRAA